MAIAQRPKDKHASRSGIRLPFYEDGLCNHGVMLFRRQFSSRLQLSTKQLRQLIHREYRGISSYA